jgi:O-antigen/teichoic acid export membrane protein
MLAGLLGVAFQSLVSHQLRPADYGAVFTVVTVITFIALPATAFTLLMARETSRGRASGHQAPSAALLRRGNRALLFLGLAIGSVLALSSELLARAFGVPVELWLAASIGVPFSIAFPLLLGEFQGEQRFGMFAFLITGQALLKLALAIVLGLLLGPFGVIAGISVAGIAVYVLALTFLRRKLAIKPNLPWLRPTLPYLGLVVPSTIALAVLLSSDVLLVKHYFAARPAGEYSAVAALGRAIFWGASAVAIVLFPKLTVRYVRGSRGGQLVAASLAFVVIGGVVGFAGMSLLSRPLLTAFAGSAYSAASTYLPLYAVGMTFLGGAAVLIATHQSRGNASFLAILIPFAVAEPGLIVGFHSTLAQVIDVVVISMAALTLCLGGLYFFQERTMARRVTPFESTAALAASRANS